MKQYLFMAKKAIKSNDLHGLKVELLGESTEYRLRQQGEFAIIETTEEITKQEVTTQNNVFRLFITNEITPKTFDEGDEVCITGVFSYRSKEKMFDYENGLNIDLLNTFLGNMGCRLKGRSQQNLAIFKHGFDDTEKVWVRSAFNLEANVVVTDSEKFNETQLSNVGGRKSYGCGCVCVK